MGHNCSTCAKRKPNIRECDDGDGHYDVWEDGIECAEGHDTMESTHPSDLRPCAHGTAIVATAVVGVEFSTDTSTRDATITVAYHGCNGMLYAINTQVDLGEWSKPYILFCPQCGHLLPTTAQLPEMYQRWREQKGANHA